jgi:hypothetical protein
MALKSSFGMFSFIYLFVNLIMKFFILYISLILICTKPQPEEDKITDKELDELLKDPKYASIAGELKSGGLDLKGNYKINI